MIQSFRRQLHNKRNFLNFTDEEMDQVDESLKLYKNTLICGAIFSVCRDTLNIATQDNIPVVDFSSLILNALNTSIELSTFGVVDNLCRIKFKPTPKTELFYTVSASVLSTCINSAIVHPFLTRYSRTPQSRGSSSSTVVQKVGYDLGFNLTHKVAMRRLPRPEKMQGLFARNTSAVVLSTAVGAYVSTPTTQILQFGREFWRTLPLILTDFSLFSIVQNTVTPYLT